MRSDTTLCGGEGHEESTVDKADIITLGDTDTHNADDTCLNISDFRGGGDDGAGDDDDEEEEEEEEEDDDVMKEPKFTGAVLGKLVVKIMNKIGLATENCVGI